MRTTEMQPMAKVEPAILGFRKDGRPIYPISGGETDDDMRYNSNPLFRFGESLKDFSQRLQKSREKFLRDFETQRRAESRRPKLPHDLVKGK